MVPFHSEAELYLPDAEIATVDGINGLSVEQVGDKVKVELETGIYAFRYKPTKNYEMIYSQVE
jgi:hypothetical protein